LRFQGARGSVSVHLLQDQACCAETQGFRGLPRMWSAAI